MNIVELTVEFHEKWILEQRRLALMWSTRFDRRLFWILFVFFSSTGGFFEFHLELAFNSSLLHEKICFKLKFSQKLTTNRRKREIYQIILFDSLAVAFKR